MLDTYTRRTTFGMDPTDGPMTDTFSGLGGQFFGNQNGPPRTTFGLDHDTLVYFCIDRDLCKSRQVIF